MDNLDSINDDTFKAWFVYNKDQFKQIYSFIKVSKPKYVSFLYKLYISLSNKQLSFLFRISKQLVMINLAREDLLMNLVPKFFNNNNRSVLINHNTLMAKILFDIPENKTYNIFNCYL